MEKKKCSLIEHKDIDSKIFCMECNTYMCNNCESFHSKLFPKHQVFNSDEDLNKIFTGFCKEKGHPIKLEFFCKTHNQLCCGICIAKIRKEEIGKHKDCDVCTIEDIKEEKKNKIEENIKCLNDILNKLQKSMEEIKLTIEKMDKNKKEVITQIQNVFTEIRKELKNREDELLKEVDIIFNNKKFDDKVLENSEKLSENIKSLLSRTENINNGDNGNKLSSFINICLNVENEVNSIIDKNNCINKYENIDYKNIEFIPRNKETYGAFIENINKFGILSEYGQDDIYDSLIIQENEIDLIKSFIGNNPKFKLLYRASIDGDTKNDFDKKCLNKQPTLALIKNKLGNRFGGYTTQNWNYDKEYDKKDPSSFIFSLDNKKMYNLKNKNNRAIQTKGYVIHFGNGDFCLGNKFLTENTGWCNKNDRYFEAEFNNLSYLENFIVQEFELYHVII